MQLTLKYMMWTASEIPSTIYCKMKESMLKLRRWKQQQSSVFQNHTQRVIIEIMITSQHKNSGKEKNHSWVAPI